MPSRRSVLATILSVSPALLLPATFSRAQDALPLPPTPSCGDDVQPTASQTAGPFYRPDSPLKRDLFADVAEAPRILLAGFVTDADCAPIEGAAVEIWHADLDGEYDIAGTRLRGHQITDSAGRWSFLTIETHQYGSRTAHYHFRVKAPDRGLLTTQLYFPDHPRNRTDSIFDPRLVLKMREDGSRRVGRFDFVV
jgi:protocatechuate 3,4-dioxygenase beta subunit